MDQICRTLLGFAIVGIAACGGGGGGTGSTGVNNGTGGTGGANCTAGDGTICVLAGSFNPIDITIAKNGSVTFQEVQGAHFIVFDAPLANGVSNIGDFSSGTASRTFNEVGTFPYHCTLHGGVGTGMHGTIKVQ
ncbi:MAG TPA: plastocyanin/azurin family copper-binding protein [Gemmatimonadaceae bacterium]|nr:plastocyanin/azurin family copper-binding protein [Gemmatimonadaceae bacterium]